MAGNLEEYPLLIGQAGLLKGLRWVLNKPLVIGRDSTCEVVIPDRQVSHFHARLTPTPEGVILEDMGSKNGTHCNGNPVSIPMTLQDGDMIQIALVGLFVFVTSDATMPLTESAERPGRLRLDLRARRVWVNQQQVEPPLSAMQFHVLQVLYENQGQVVERQEIIASAWGDEQAVGVSDQALDALVRRLRDRLAELDAEHTYIVTVRGHGLRLDNPPMV
jgi:pSer/pThr/pTyr-binding forkhead associated (FHA) protein